MSTREDLARFCGLEIDFDAIGLEEPGQEQVPYFCDPVGAEHVGRIGCDGVHFVLLSGDERVYCVDPAMGEIGTYVLPVAETFSEFLSYILYCRDAAPISQISWMTEERFRGLLKENAENRWEGCEDFFRCKEEALAKIREEFSLEPQEPFGMVRALQASFDPSEVMFSEEYYDVLGVESPVAEDLG